MIRRMSLQGLIKQSDEYKAYDRIKDEVYEDEQNKRMIKDYKSSNLKRRPPT